MSKKKNSYLSPKQRRQMETLLKDFKKLCHIANTLTVILLALKEK